MAVELSGSATSLTPMSSRRPTVRFSAYIFLMLVVLLAFAGVFVLYVQAEKKIDRANETRFLAIDLTQELRRSSDDLTRLARMFVVTGDPTYKAQYQEVLDIRDGKRLRPAFPGNENLGPEIGIDYRRLGAGVAVPLLDLMRQVGFTANEMAALAAAKSDSDALALLELASMGAVASDASPDISRHAQAIAALHDATYARLKSGIMLPIGKVEDLVNVRTLHDVQHNEARAVQLRLALIALGLAQIFLLWMIHRQLLALLGGSVQELQSVIARLGSGNFSQTIDPSRGERNSVLGWLIETNNKLSRLELRQYRAIVNSTDDAIISETLSGIITSWNPAAEKMFGYAANEVVGKSVQVIIPPGRHGEQSEILSKIALGERIDHLETVRVCKDGRLITISATVSPIRDEDGNIIGASKISRDITERNRAERELANTTRALKTLSACSAALIHAVDEAELLDMLCRLIVEIGGYRMAWVGRAENDAEKIVRPEAWFGAGADYLSQVKITWADDQWGRGPTGTAIRSGLVQVNQNFLTNPAVALWRSNALEHGYQASIALPLKFAAGDLGALTIYAVEYDAFDPAEVQLLNELADNVAYGIDGLRNRAEKEALVDRVRKLSLAVEQSPESIAITDIAGRIEYVNEAFLRNTGYTRDEVIGQNPRILQSGMTPPETYVGLWQALVAGQVWTGELYNRRKDGSDYIELAVISPIRDAAGVITHYLGVKEDITAKKQAEERIHHLAYYDSLTDLPNRRLLIERLQVALASNMQVGRLGALFYVDLDNFKTINDTLGHNLGDELLRQVATRLRESVAPGDSVAHLGGDDFIVLVPDLGADPLQAKARARDFGARIVACFHAPFLLDRAECRACASIGVTLFGQPRDTVEELLKQVEIALYQAKEAGRNALRFFDADMQALVIAQATLEADLHAALRQGEFLLHYQIQVDDTGKPIGAEALVRWQHPRRGLLAPGAFIGSAEKTGLIVPIGAWVLETACVQLAAWASRPEMRQFSLGVNVSARQFRQPDFVQRCLESFARTGVNPNRLKLEPTESLLQENVEDTIAKMSALRAHGVRFALDDFGTGYSSLTYLRRLPLDQLKIDQSFVSDLPGEPNACVIARAIIALGQSLGLAVIAEGVETAEQRAFLQSNGCLQYQGYFFGRPMPVGEFEAAVRLR